jgi:hypothetical protein
MRKEIIIALAAFFFMTLSAITGVYAFEESGKVRTLYKHKIDVTGDGTPETVLLKGVPYEKDDEYMKNISIEVITSTKKIFKSKFESGIRPYIIFVDLNHDGVKDVFLTIPTGGSGGISNHYLYTYKNLVEKDLTVPKPLLIKGQFINGYKAKATVAATGDNYVFDLINRKKEYEQMGLYRKGRLNEPTELMANGYESLTPIMNKEGQLGLKGFQMISGAAHADSIASVVSIWYFTDGKWKLTAIKVHPIRQ